MDNPLISFILPVYNVGDLLRECVDSILDQDFTSFEIVLVNDGSTDQSASICEDYSDRYLNINLVTKENGGLADARNAGLPFCNGEYVWFVDSDDFLIPNILSKINYYLKSKPNILLFNFRETGAAVDRDVKKFDTEKELFNGSEIIQKYNSYGIQAWTQIYKLDYIVKNKLLFTKGALYEDVIFNLPVYASVSRIKLVNDVFYCYRQREGSIMNSNVKLKNITSLLNIFDVMLAIYKKRSLPQDFLTNRFDYYLGLILQFYQVAKLSSQDKRVLFSLLESKKYIVPTKKGENRYFWFVKTYGLRYIPRIVFELYPLVLRVASFKKKYL